MQIKRKADRIKILEDSITGIDTTLRCEHCKERSLQPKKGDNNNLFCITCGNLTPIRSIKHARGLSAPSIQQPTAIVQSQTSRPGERKPQGINRKKSALEESLVNHGYQIIDINYVEPVPR